MTGLPESARYGRQVPKNKIYAMSNADAAMKSLYVAQVERVTWLYKLAPGTLNVQQGSAVEEIQVLHIVQRVPELDAALLEKLERIIAYHIVLLLEFDGRQRLRIAYKERAQGAGGLVVRRVYAAPWAEPADICLTVRGLDMDAVYADFVVQVGGQELARMHEQTATVGEAVAREAECTAALKELKKVLAKMRTTKQTNILAELNTRRRALEARIAHLKGENNG